VWAGGGDHGPACPTAFHFGPVLGVQRLSDVGPKEDTQAGQRAFLLEKKTEIRPMLYYTLFMVRLLHLCFVCRIAIFFFGSTSNFIDRIEAIF
jgi:hypothetical protein